MLKLIFIANLLSTIFMAGVIWIVQVVHYPLFAQVGSEMWRSYHNSHNVLITLIVLPAMFIEAGTSALLVLGRPSHVTLNEAIVGLALVVLAWGTTFFLSVPNHNLLAASFNAEAHRALVNTNWIRTFAWSAHSILVCWQVYKLM